MASQHATDGKIDNRESDMDTKMEVEALKAAYPRRCRVMCDVGEYKTVITLQPEDLDATIKFHLTAAYPSVIPDIKVRSESLTDEKIEELQLRLKVRAQELIGKEMIQNLMEEAQAALHLCGLRPGKAKKANEDTYLLDKKKGKNKKQKSKAKVAEDDDSESKKPSMKTALDVVNRIIWDDNLDTELFLVGYIDRFRGLLEKYFSAFSWEDISTVDYDVLAIPKHRIQYFKYKDVKVWDKTMRVDNVFGSANGTKTIDIVIKELEEQEALNGANNESLVTPSLASDDDNDSEDSSDDEDFITVTISDCVNIGTPKTDEAAAKKEGCDDGNQLNRYWTDKLRPNYFLCIRITDENIIDRIGNVQDSMLQREPLLGECCIPGASLHITVCMLGLDTAEQLQQCMEVLRTMKSDLSKVLPKSTLKIKGVSHFNSRVVYAKVECEKDFLEFHETLKLNLQEAGVQIRDGYEYVPHITILKTTRPVSRARRSKNIDPSYYQQFSDFEFGKQKVISLYLCSVGDKRRSDGFYLTPLELHFEE